MIQFLSDTGYDLFHLKENRIVDFSDWWITRRVEFARLFGRRSKYDNTYT